MSQMEEHLKSRGSHGWGFTPPPQGDPVAEGLRKLHQILGHLGYLAAKACCSGCTPGFDLSLIKEAEKLAEALEMSAVEQTS
jgi:hypothetical protein